MGLGEKIWGNSIGANVVYGKDGTTLVPLKVNADGELVVNLEAATVNIGDVDIQSLPSGNLGQQHKAASLSIAPADDIADGTYLGDIKFGEALPDTTGADLAGTHSGVDAINGKLPAMSDSQVPVSAGYKLKRINATFTGIGATSQYDAVGTLTEIPNWATANGRGATIREIRISVNNNAIAPQFELHFFNASDATVAADNVTWTELAADYTKRAGYVIMPACAKATGSGTIDMVRAQSDDYGQSLAKEVVCAAGSTSVWLALKLLTTGISFAGSPGNTIAVSMVIEQS